MTINKKIMPSSKTSGIREEFKKTFLPLLIDIFEIRQLINNFKSNSFKFDKNNQSPKELLYKLQQLQNDVEESKRWHEGIIMQISKGIEAATEAIQVAEGKHFKKYKLNITKESEKQKNYKYFFKWFFKKIKKDSE